MSNKKTKKINTFEGGTKEWDSNEWQGRSEQQVEAGNKILHYVLIVVIALFWGWGLVKIFTLI